mgnify:CR=1 FL=1
MMGLKTSEVETSELKWLLVQVEWFYDVYPFTLVLCGYSACQIVACSWHTMTLVLLFQVKPGDNSTWT